MNEELLQERIKNIQREHEQFSEELKDKIAQMRSDLNELKRDYADNEKNASDKREATLKEIDRKIHANETSVKKLEYIVENMQSAWDNLESIIKEMMDAQNKIGDRASTDIKSQQKMYSGIVLELIKMIGTVAGLITGAKIFL